MSDWITGFTQVTFPQSLGFAHRDEVCRVVWHTTQGWCAEHAFNVYANASKGACPHITTEYAGTGGHGTDRAVTKRNFQHVPLTLASYGLQRGNAQHPCRVETNGAGVIQIERVGFADDDVSTEELVWLGEKVLAPILCAFPSIPDSVYQSDHRMTEAQWHAWHGGQCGHRNVCCQPDGHSDPGPLDLDAILEYALRAINPPKEADMPEYVLRNGHDHTQPWLAVYPNGALRHIGGTEAGCLINGKYDNGTQFRDGTGLQIVDEFDTPAYERARASAGA